MSECIDTPGATFRCIDMGVKLDEFGRSGAESAVRPMALTRDERFVYAQISFLHGFVEYDLVNSRITRIAELPASRAVRDLPAHGQPVGVQFVCENHREEPSEPLGRTRVD